MPSKKISFRFATQDDAPAVMTITNEAFIADQFFKKPQYHDRFDYSTVVSMINAQNSVFIVAEGEDDNGINEIIGSLYLHWEIKLSDSERTREVVGKFSAVSVPNRFSKRGIGKALVDMAEKKVIGLASSFKEEDTLNTISTTASLQMGVINERQDLFPWYARQGFEVIGEIRGDPEIDRITLDDYRASIYLVLMSKSLACSTL